VACGARGPIDRTRRDGVEPEVVGHGDHELHVARRGAVTVALRGADGVTAGRPDCTG
jgi:hypothetical protein